MAHETGVVLGVRRPANQSQWPHRLLRKRLSKSWNISRLERMAMTPQRKARKDEGSLFCVLAKKKLVHGHDAAPNTERTHRRDMVCARVGYALHRVYVRAEGGLSVAPLCHASVGRRERGPLGGEIP
ncbi:hypothetical protein B0H13DRAFT_1887087 [Mycena leptocephala]|nr:hypothetical protein B0H13DRAFT_1887087 [Mycena leptocephala]